MSPQVPAQPQQYRQNRTYIQRRRRLRPHTLVSRSPLPSTQSRWGVTGNSVSHTLLPSYDVCEGQLPIEGDVLQSVSPTHSLTVTSLCLISTQRSCGAKDWERCTTENVSHAKWCIPMCLIQFTVTYPSVSLTVIYLNVSHSQGCVPMSRSQWYIPMCLIQSDVHQGFSFKVIYPSVSHSQWCIPMGFIWSDVPKCVSVKTMYPKDYHSLI